MTKYAKLVTEPDKIRYHLERALYLAYNGRPGPCWLDIPLNVQSALIDPDSLPAYDPAEDRAELPPEVTKDTVEKVIKLLNSAKRPVIIVGGGIRLAKSRDKLLKFLEKVKVPIVTAWNSHDLIPDSHPLYSGRSGSMGDRGGNFVVQNSDLLLALGCRLSIRQVSYNWEQFAPSAYKIMVDIDPVEMEKPTLKIDMKIHADVSTFFDYMLKNSKLNIKAPENWLEYCRKINLTYPVVLPEYMKKSDSVNPYVFFKKLFTQLREDEIIVSGNGSACVCSFQAAVIKENTRLYTNSGCASMGYGLPAAIGACVAAGKRVICLEGDGSLQMNLQELQTLAYRKLPIKVFILNNQGYYSIRQTQSSFFGLPLVGVGPDSGVGFAPLEKLAYAFGLCYYKIENHEYIDEKIADILQNNEPVLIEIIIDINQPFSPKLSSVKRDDGTMYSPPLEDMAPFLPRDELEKNMKISRECMNNE
jgi:acetolactate synthase-1/2/3 large subunit